MRNIQKQMKAVTSTHLNKFHVTHMSLLTCNVKLVQNNYTTGLRPFSHYVGAVNMFMEQEFFVTNFGSDVRVDMCFKLLPSLEK